MAMVMVTVMVIVMVMDMATVTVTAMDIMATMENNQPIVITSTNW